MKVKTAEQYAARYHRRGLRNLPRTTKPGPVPFDWGMRPGHAKRFADIRDCFPLARKAAS